MKKMIICLVLACSTLISVSSFAEIVKINTNDRKFRVPRETLLQGPGAGGYLKALFSNEQKMAATRQRDGSYFVDVDSESMRVALGYIRTGRMDEIALKRALIASDIDFLFPGLSIKATTRKTEWKCVAYCYSYNSDWSRVKNTDVLTTIDTDVSKAWVDLNTQCRDKGGRNVRLSFNNTGLITDASSSFASMSTSCMQTSVEE